MGWLNTRWSPWSGEDDDRLRSHLWGCDGDEMNMEPRREAYSFRNMDFAFTHANQALAVWSERVGIAMSERHKRTMLNEPLILKWFTE